MTVHTFPEESIEKEAAAYCSDILSNSVSKHNRVFLLLSGGSAISMYKKMEKLLPHELDLSGLHVGLVDERFVTFGSPDSNQRQLSVSGVIAGLEKRGATFVGQLVPDLDVQDQNERGTKVAWASSLLYELEFEWAQEVLLFAGIGPDGHTAGWLPTRDQMEFDSLYTKDQAVVFYEVDPENSDNPHRERLTLSTRYLTEIDQAIIYAKGSDKKEALEELAAQKLELYQCPALLLHSVPVTTLLTDVAFKH